MEIFFPSGFSVSDQHKWLEQRGLRPVSSFARKPNCPDGILQTPWERIIWSDHCWLPV